MKLIRAIFAAAILCLVPTMAHAQYVNSNQLPDANFNTTTPTPDTGYRACTFKTSGRNVICELQSGVDLINNITYSTTPVIALASGNVQQFACTTAGAAIVPTITGLTAGKSFTLIFVQNGTTPCTFTFPATVHGATAVSATLSSISTQRFVVSGHGTDAYAEAAGTSASGGTP